MCNQAADADLTASPWLQRRAGSWGIAEQRGAHGSATKIEQRKARGEESGAQGVTTRVQTCAGKAPTVASSCCPPASAQGPGRVGSEQ